MQANESSHSDEQLELLAQCCHMQNRTRGSNCQLEAQEAKYELIHCSTAVRGGKGFNHAWLDLTKSPWLWECCGCYLAQRNKL